MRASAEVAKMASLLVMFLPRLVAESNTEQRPGFLRVGQITHHVAERDEADQRVLQTTPEDEPTSSPTMMPTMEISTCSNGFPGIQRGDVCCAMECGICGGSGCGSAPGGAESCCTNRILSTGSPCSDVGEAPCFITDDEPTPSPTVAPTLSTVDPTFMMPTMEPTISTVDPTFMMPTMEPTISTVDPTFMMPTMEPTMMPTMEASTCSNGFPGIQTDNVCCAVECGQCGGRDCGDAPGGADSCCISRILSTGGSCSDVGEAPCFISADGPTPSPTMMPTITFMPTTTGPTITPTMTPSLEETTCLNGFAGIQNGNVCCPLSCGQCGGMDCSSAPGGADSCCTSRILTTGSSCSAVSEAPCFIGADGPTPSPTMMPTITFMPTTMGPTIMPTMMPSLEETTCLNGFAGIQNGNVCCPLSCGQCGGMDCSSAPGGADSCCTSRILTTGSSCSAVSEAPCFIGADGPTPSPTMMPTITFMPTTMGPTIMPTMTPSLEETTCLNGFAGIQNGNVCCPLSCGQCGGVGCSSAPGGADSCCTSRILTTGSSCSAVSEAPCFIGADGPTPSPTMMPTITFMPTTMGPTIMPTMMPSLEETTCLNGFAGIQNGNVCCPLSCGQCGGMDCSSAPGGADSCCTSRILTTGSSCSAVSEAPCFIGADGPTPSPTMMPTITFMPTTMGPTIMPTMTPSLEETTCLNGFAGIQNGNVCCPLSCGQCGGMDCSSAPGGADSCCTSRILTTGSSCSAVSEAPCFIGADGPTPSPTMMPTITFMPTTMGPTIMPTMTPSLEETTCLNGFAGIQNGNVCCPLSCGQCGGMDCSSAPGGADSCCTSRILTTGSSCSAVSEAPCFIGADGPTPSPTMMPTTTSMPTTMRPTMTPTTDMSTCSNGFLGIQNDNVCCDAECGFCGGVGCSSAPGGADSCCTARILSTGSPCSEAGEAPCFISCELRNSGQRSLFSSDCGHAETKTKRRACLLNISPVESRTPALSERTIDRK